MQIQKSFQTSENGKLYLVPTPIGNLKDMSIRSIEVLKEVDLIAAEDTRNTQKILNHFEIETKKTSFHEHNKETKINTLIDILKNGESIAQVSDAGMPSISDPGHELVEACIKNNISVISIPGATAGLSSLIASGIAPQPNLFYGFLPRKISEQKNSLNEVKDFPFTIIFYEAPHRLKKTLKSMVEILGDREIVLAREVTKKYEEYLRGTIHEMINWFEENEVRGEFVLLVSGNSNPQSNEDDPLVDLAIDKQVQFLIDKGEKTNEAIKKIAKKNEIKRQEVYNIYHQID
ncbi:16S rRNA (cytidine(1402)-2'-O)-methyltransferase [Lactobacillus sp. S2-2]|uniref:16S rRNA (cytidine(1402)-2'-O)-methyltransferase n=1 Tax=Lactobacillus sp. S2-2 TaxID=2692917 RepID=UPI001EFFC651|nr:16S rRNA (cytidine(1402)-2'-O)-methyltransferase [Lactobacillus sp. S2-2]MCF6515665.1 16S rRNA (cytidine(1402)-2'-O)-methyltransferase [Lactobacillus sp. S2-2]